MYRNKGHKSSQNKDASDPAYPFHIRQLFLFFFFFFFFKKKKAKTKKKKEEEERRKKEERGERKRKEPKNKATTPATRQPPAGQGLMAHMPWHIHQLFSNGERKEEEEEEEEKEKRKRKEAKSYQKPGSSPQQRLMALWVF